MLKLKLGRIAESQIAAVKCVHVKTAHVVLPVSVNIAIAIPAAKHNKPLMHERLIK